jgi:hypothetical protein
VGGLVIDYKKFSFKRRARYKLRVLVSVVQMFPTGEAKRSLNVFPLIEAPDPDDHTKTIKLEIATSTIEKLVVAKRRTQLFEAWAHLVGDMPPVNNAELVRRTEYNHASFATIRDAFACFQGVRRRYADNDVGSNVYVFVISTAYTVRWQSDMRCVANIVKATAGTVLTVQAKKADSLQGCSESVWGAITKWEFINADREQPGFPDSYGDRYDRLLWQKSS